MKSTVFMLRGDTHSGEATLVSPYCLSPYMGLTLKGKVCAPIRENSLVLVQTPFGKALTIQESTEVLPLCRNGRKHVLWL